MRRGGRGNYQNRRDRSDIRVGNRNPRIKEVEVPADPNLPREEIPKKEPQSEENKEVEIETVRVPHQKGRGTSGARKIGGLANRRTRFVRKNRNRLERAEKTMKEKEFENEWEEIEDDEDKGGERNNNRGGRNLRGGWKKIFIDRLPEWVDNKKLYGLFRSEGKITACRVIYDKLGLSKGYGVIEFLYAADAHNVVQRFRGRRFKGNDFIIRYQRNGDKAEGRKEGNYNNRDRGFNNRDRDYDNRRFRDDRNYGYDRNRRFNNTDYNDNFRFRRNNNYSEGNGYRDNDYGYERRRYRRGY